MGGGSDMEAFYSQYPGAVLSTSINKYMYISSHRFFEPDKIRVKYSQTETVSNPDELEHRILREALKAYGKKGIEISSIADVPSGTGMGSSSAFTVGLLHNLHAAEGRLVSKEQLAEEACRLEIEQLKEPIGKQDQYAAALGGMNVLRFLPNGKVTIEPVYMNNELWKALESHLVMFYTGQQRSASKILAEQKKNLPQNNRIEILRQMTLLVDELKEALVQGNLEAMGHLLHENWMLKQQLASGISNPLIAQAYEAARSAGALGGKLLGAGGGGFLLFFCPPERQEKLKQALHKLRTFDFAFESEGSSLIYYGREQ